MKSSHSVSLLFFVAAAVHAQTPVITSVVNAASLDNHLAPGGLAIVNGTNFGSLTSIAVTVGGKSAKVIAAASTQLTIQIPFEASATSNPNLLVVGSSSTFKITLSQFGPGVFSSSGLAAAFHQGNVPVTETNPAKPGETISLDATGLGPTTPPVATGSFPPSGTIASAVTPTITVGGISGKVLSAVLSSTQYGHYVVTFTLPSTMPAGDRLLVLSTGTTAAAAVTLPVAATGPFILSGHVRNGGGLASLSATAGLAEGSYIVIQGTGFTDPSTLPPNLSDRTANLPYPITLFGASVNITPSGGSPISAYLTFVQDTQINAILPSNVPVGPATVTVSYKGNTSPPEPINVVHTSFGIPVTASPIGAAAIINNSTTALYNLFTNAANPGDFMSLYGTGLGPVTGGDNVSPGAVTPAGIDLNNVKVLVGGQVIAAEYAGRNAVYPALDQINFHLPADGSVPEGCYVPIAVQVNGQVSNYGTMAVSNSSRTCPAPLGLTSATLQRLDQGGKVNVGIGSLSHSGVQATVSELGLTVNINEATEEAGAAFAALDGPGVFSLLQTPGAIPPLNSPGTCVVESVDAFSPPSTTVPPVPVPLDAGSKLTLAGPNSKNADLPKQTGIGYGAFLAQTGASVSTPIGTFPLAGVIPGIPVVPAGLPASFIEPGTWVIKGTGGADIGPFSANITVPSPLVCTNCDQLTTIDRSQPVTVQWTGGGTSQDYVEIVGVGTTPSLADKTQNVAVLFACAARATDGKLTIPANILGQLPVASSNPLDPNVGALLILNGLGASDGSFTAPLTAGGNLDVGYFGYNSILIKLASYK